MSLLERVARRFGFERVRVGPAYPYPHTMAWYLDKMYAFSQAHGFQPSDIYVHPKDEAELAFMGGGHSIDGMRLLGMTWHISANAAPQMPILWHETLDPSVRRFVLQQK